MIVIIAKILIDGKWMNIDGSKLFVIGQIVPYNDEDWAVTNIVGSKITLEKVV